MCLNKQNKCICDDFMCLQEIDALKSQIVITQATADASATSAQSVQLQCLALLKELDKKSCSLKENEDRVNRLGELLNNLQKDLQTREYSQKQLREEITKTEHDIMEALAKSDLSKDSELRKLLDVGSPKNIENINKLLVVKDEEIGKMRDEIRIMSAHWKLKAKDLESQHAGMEFSCSVHNGGFICLLGMIAK
ncbi:hypothetical protein BT93_B1192 [Corymbia citriodora subsp. variegata]|nr:hypothetical protein BT93_B1192 [Corymbia citriodora subsp. variegata]